MDQSPTGLFEKIKIAILDILFPRYCLGCSKPGAYLCPSCLGKLPRKESQLCPYCEKEETPGGKPCPRCRQQLHSLPLDRMVVASDYHTTLLAKTIHTFKYRFVRELSVPLGDLITQAISSQPIPIPDYIIPLPLHSARLRWRGFNQSELLASHLSTRITPGLAIPVLNDIVIRTKNTCPQMSLTSADERKTNINGAFSIATKTSFGKPALSPDNSPLLGKKILLVDDICTTGSTLFECARTLRQLKPHSVSAVVLARQRQ